MKYILSTEADDFNDNLFNLSHKIVPLCSPDWAPDWVSSWWSGWRMTDDGRLSPGSGLRGPILRPAAGYYELPPTQRPGIVTNCYESMSTRDTDESDNEVGYNRGGIG